MGPRRALPVILGALAGAMTGSIPVPAQTSPVVAARLAALRVVMDHHGAPQGKMLRCLRLIEPRQAERAEGDWRGMLVKAGDAMTTAQIPARDQRALLAPLTVEALTASGGRPAESKAECEAAEDWQNRWATFQSQTFASDVRAVLTGRR